MSTDAQLEEKLALAAEWVHEARNLPLSIWDSSSCAQAIACARLSKVFVWLGQPLRRTIAWN